MNVISKHDGEQVRARVSFDGCVFLFCVVLLACSVVCDSSERLTHCNTSTATATGATTTAASGADSGRAS